MYTSKTAIIAAIRAVAPWCLLLFLLPACSSDLTSDDEPAFPTSSEVITISGGGLGGSAAKSRAVNLPALPGICQADKMTIWVYYNNKYAWGDISDLTYKETISKDLRNTTQQGGSVDRWVRHTYSYTADGATGNHFAMPALAYSQADESKFTVSYTGKYTEMRLTLTDAALPSVPELFFGRTKFTHEKIRSGSYFDNGKWLDEGRNYYYQYGTSNQKYDNAPMSGHLFRIVSKLSVQLTEVPTEVVERMELLATRVPKSIGLYGTHGNIYGSDDIGRLYPVAAATKYDHTFGASKSIVASTSDFPDKTATLSSFFLPSEVGMELTLRVHFKDGAMVDAEGNSILRKDFAIKPGKSAFLTGDAADCYSVGSLLQSGSDLYVYNATEAKFYSYANVRVNIRATYDDAATDPEKAEITLEVEPGYERVHTIEIK